MDSISLVMEAVLLKNSLFMADLSAFSRSSQDSRKTTACDTSSASSMKPTNCAARLRLHQYLTK
ncbi:hypothetical protein [Pseudorhizobium pelagicum]|uniref:hypothetical protein n=1 Tax=Pseudorhizobium pelagicum TaxID=1509405 RepID=UPI002989ACE1